MKVSVQYNIELAEALGEVKLLKRELKIAKEERDILKKQRRTSRHRSSKVRIFQEHRRRYAINRLMFEVI